MGVDGLNVLEAIRREDRLRTLALVVHVAVPEPGRTDASDGAGGDDTTEFRSQAYLTHGINWPSMRAEMEEYVQ